MSNTALAKIEFDKEQVEVIKKQFFPPNASEAEMSYCFAVARELGLNPITKEIFFVPRRQKDAKGNWQERLEPMISRDGLLNIACRRGVLAGMETKVEVKEVPTLENGKWVNKPDLCATTTVWARGSDRPFIVTVCYSEYVQLGSDGQATKFWREKKLTMLAKVSESHALRRVANISGIYTPEECQLGMVTESGDLIIEQATGESETGRSTPSRNKLAVVAPPAAKSAPPIEVAAEEVWPEPAAPEPSQSTLKATPEECGISDIISLLEAKSISYDLDMETGLISAKSYDQRQLLKDNGFRWNADTKAWVFNFEPPPF